MNVSIVIPNYNGEKYILDCIASIYDQIEHKQDIIVIDNHSTDLSVSLIKSKYPDITLIENDNNKGFAAAVNQGIQASKAKYVILLNNDAFARSGFVQALCHCMESDSRIFSAGAKMLRYSEPDLIDDAGDELTIFGWAYKVGDGQPSEKFNKQRRIFSACAGAAIYRRELFEEIGYFDESFFAYLEDVDIGFRANLHGYMNVFCPSAEVEHVGSATSGSRHNDFKIKISARNNVWLCLKNLPYSLKILNGLFIIVGILIKFAFFSYKGFSQTYATGLREAWDKRKYYSALSKKIKLEWIDMVRIELHLIKATFLLLMRK